MQIERHRRLPISYVTRMVPWHRSVDTASPYRKAAGLTRRPAASLVVAGGSVKLHSGRPPGQGRDTQVSRTETLESTNALACGVRGSGGPPLRRTAATPMRGLPPFCAHEGYPIGGMSARTQGRQRVCPWHRGCASHIHTYTGRPSLSHTACYTGRPARSLREVTSCPTRCT